MQSRHTVVDVELVRLYRETGIALRDGDRVHQCTVAILTCLRAERVKLNRALQGLACGTVVC
jgi:hypothetical protein